MSINQVTLKGHLGQDPEQINSIVKFSIATTETVKNKEGNFDKKTNWHSCISFGKTAENIIKYFKKGDEILIIGRLDYSRHDEKYYTNILVNSFDFCGKRDNEQTEQKEAFERSTESQPDSDDLPF